MDLTFYAFLHSQASGSVTVVQTNCFLFWKIAPFGWLSL